MQKEQIDGCVILEAVLGKKKAKRRPSKHKSCRRYFYHLAERRNGLISLPALGEVFKCLLEIPDNKIAQQTFFGVCDLINDCQILRTSPKLETYQKVLEIMKFDNRLEPADSLRIAEAIIPNASLVTIDSKLIEDRL